MSERGFNFATLHKCRWTTANTHVIALRLKYILFLFFVYLWVTKLLVPTGNNIPDEIHDPVARPRGVLRYCVAHSQYRI